MKDGNIIPLRFEDDSTLDQIAGKTSARVSGFAENLNNPNYRQELYFTFEVKKSDSDGDGIEERLPVEIWHSSLTCANIVEILSYSTDEGLIDNDSAPGNVATIGYEDDTDKAQGINIKIKSGTRKISGTVFEDIDKKGDNNDNVPINDVIVQLIEVKNIDGKNYEYIWQETTSGPLKSLKTISDEYIFTDEQVRNFVLMDEDGDGLITKKNVIIAEYALIGFIPDNLEEEMPLLHKYLDYWFDDIKKDKNEIDNSKYKEPQYEVFLKVIDSSEDVNSRKWLAYEYINNIYDMNNDGRVHTTDINILESFLNLTRFNEENDGVTIKDGTYQFMNFIPGNYIIRFIYGDGTTYDITENVEKYNGQDYKSTIDKYYNQEWYNEQIENYGGNPSVARDNEARRLEVMSYSTMIDKDKAVALASLNKKFDKLTDAEKEKLKNYYTNVFLNDTYKDFIKNKYNEYKEPDITDLNNTTQEQQYELLKYYVLQNTWMAAETSKINVPVDANDDTTKAPGKGAVEKTGDDKTAVSFNYIVDRIEYENVNFGLALRPQTKLELEKHITGIKITPNGAGVQSIVEAKAEIENIVNGSEVTLKGLKTGITAIKSTRDERGFWKVETDIEELAQGALLEVEYTYVIKNVSEEDDYLSKYLVRAYENYYSDSGIKYDTYDTYEELLQGKGVEIKTATKGITHSYGTYLGQHYYTGDAGGNDALVSSRAETLEEALNEQLGKQENVGNNFSIKKDADGKNIIETVNYIDTNSKIELKEVNTIIESNSPSEFLNRKKPGENFTSDSADWNKTAKLTTVLSSIRNGEIGGEYASYIAEITKYSNAAGRRNMEAEPDNLTYVDSKDTQVTMNSITYKDAEGIVHETTVANPDTPEGVTTIREQNEMDEFWGESIIITKPTGEDKITGVQIAIIATASVAIIGAGIILIKKFVLKK